MIPSTQIRAVDPFSTYISAHVNYLTRIVTDGQDKICRDSNLKVTYGNSNTIIISGGTAIKDDVVLIFPDNFSLSVTSSSNYTDGNLISNTGVSYPKIVYVVLKYDYRVVDPAPVAEILLYKDIANFSSSSYLFLGAITFTSASTISSSGILDTHNGISRNVLNLTSAYTDEMARNAQSSNSILNHSPSNADDYNKLIATDSESGQIIFKSMADFSIPWSQMYDQTHYNTDNELVITHNLGHRPIVAVYDYDSHEEIKPSMNKADSVNTQILKFDDLKLSVIVELR